MKNIAVIGAGASGMLAAIAAADNARVTVFEKNEYAGRKLLQTGNGKCNFLNEAEPSGRYRGSLWESGIAENILSKYDRDFILGLFSSFGLLYHKKNGCFYPRSDSAGSVNDVLVSELRARGVTLKFSTPVKKIEQKDKKFYLTLSDLGSGKKYADNTSFDAVIIAAGGKAAPKTGSTGDAYYFAEGFKLCVVPPLPGLTKLMSPDAFFSDNNVRAYASVKLYIEGVISGEAKGELQVSKTGPSGICVFDLSGRAATALKENKSCYLSVDLLPEYSADEIAVMLDKKSDVIESGQLLKAALFMGMFSDRLSEAVCAKLEHEMSSVKKDALIRETAKRLKDLRFQITGTGDFGMSQVTVGGIDAESLNPDLSVKSVPGLYFAGECLDIDGDCGGFNLHWAWSSGYACGVAASVE